MHIWACQDPPNEHGVNAAAGKALQALGPSPLAAQWWHSPLRSLFFSRTGPFSHPCMDHILSHIPSGCSAHLSAEPFPSPTTHPLLNKINSISFQVIPLGLSSSHLHRASLRAHQHPHCASSLLPTSLLLAWVPRLSSPLNYKPHKGWDCAYGSAQQPPERSTGFSSL